MQTVATKTSIAGLQQRPGSLLKVKQDKMRCDACRHLVDRGKRSRALAVRYRPPCYYSLESWTAIPYYERTPRPQNPIQRPAYQGSNPISDIFSLQALKSTVQYLPRAVKDPDDFEAQSQMLLAATLAGVGFGNAGVHLCHGMSYPISGQNKMPSQGRGSSVLGLAFMDMFKFPAGYCARHHGWHYKLLEGSQLSSGISKENTIAGNVIVLTKSTGFRALSRFAERFLFMLCAWLV